MIMHMVQVIRKTDLRKYMRKYMRKYIWRQLKNILIGVAIDFDTSIILNFERQTYFSILLFAYKF